MTPKQLFQNLVSELKTITWPSVSNLVFGEKNVHVVPTIPIQKIAQYQSPTCFVQDSGSTAYEMHDQLQEQGFTLTIFVENFGNAFGNAVLEGGNRASATNSKGAGIWDIEQRVIEHFRTVTTLSSAKITLKHKSKVRTTPVKGDNAPSCFRELSFSALTSTDTGTTPDHTQILRSPGRLFWNPSNPSGGSYGTLLGYIATGVIFDPGYQFQLLSIEDSGNTPKLAVFTGMKAQMVAELLNYNSDTIARCFLGMTTSNKVIAPGSVKTGEMYSDSDFTSKVLFVPDDTTNNVAVMLYKAFPIIANFLRFSRGEDTSLKCVFNALPDGSDRLFYVGPISQTP